MKKWELGLFALLLMVGNYLNGLFGMMIAICLYMVATGLFEELVNNRNKKSLEEKVGGLCSKR